MPAAFRASPEFDGATLALAAGAGRGNAARPRRRARLLAIGLSATDYVGHTYGTEGEEMCLQLLELDRELGDFFAVLDSRGIDYAVALTADHGGSDIPERLRLAGRGRCGAGRPGADRTATMGKALVAASSASPGPVLLGDGSAGDIYLDRSLHAGATATRAARGAVAAYRAHPQVEAVFTATRSRALRCRPATRQLDADPARPRLVRSASARATSSSC